MLVTINRLFVSFAVNFLEENKKLHEAVSDLSLPTVDFFEISSTAEGVFVCVCVCMYACMYVCMCV